MTEKRRRTAAEKFRAMLDSGVLRKEAVRLIRAEFRIGRSTLYTYCAKFGIDTR